MGDGGPSSTMVEVVSGEDRERGRNRLGSLDVELEGGPRRTSKDVLRVPSSLGRDTSKEGLRGVSGNTLRIGDLLESSDPLG